ncbi:hypothetical protein E3N88_17632 [Mikania micrantha]|uniref:Uncharacterized protein n=1 Tax=Mikania micrantha TaxID=192012 RepID=A0A5N6NSE5_9ASTR|nr:hypothetical protein E3N88_17632 [Mikania micrantha]
MIRISLQRSEEDDDSDDIVVACRDYSHILHRRTSFRFRPVAVIVFRVLVPGSVEGRYNQVIEVQVVGRKARQPDGGAINIGFDSSIPIKVSNETLISFPISNNPLEPTMATPTLPFETPHSFIQYSSEALTASQIYRPEAMLGSGGMNLTQESVPCCTSFPLSG